MTAVPKLVIKQAAKVTGLDTGTVKKLLSDGWTLEFNDGRVSAFVHPAEKSKTVESTVDMYKSIEATDKTGIDVTAVNSFADLPKIEYTPAELRFKDDQLRRELSSLLNSQSRENVSSTPDYILADLMVDALITYERAAARNYEWHGRA